MHLWLPILSSENLTTKGRKMPQTSLRISIFDQVTKTTIGRAHLNLFELTFLMQLSWILRARSRNWQCRDWLINLFEAMNSTDSSVLQSYIAAQRRVTRAFENL